TAIGLAWVTLQYRLVEILSLEHINVLKNMKDSVIVLNENNRVLYINPVTEQLFNKTEDQVIGQPFEQVAGVFAQKLHLHTTKQEHHTEINVEVGNETKTYEVNVSTITSDQRNSRDRVIALHDISERKTKEAELHRRGSIMSAISMAAEQFLKSSEWENNIPDVLKRLGQAANVSRVLVMVNSLDENKNLHSSVKYEWTATGTQPQINNPALQNISLEKSGFGRWVDTLTEGYSIYGVVREFPKVERDFLSPLGSLSIAAIPIFVEGHWWGFLIFDERQSELQWTTTELDAFQTAASIFGAAEARARTARKLYQRQLSMELLQEIVAVALQAETVLEMAETVTDRLAGLIKADGCFLTLWDEATHRTIPIAA
ncbi:MAG: PAS domain-containing protein, partial [Flavobacteriales bacterium]|nr:PAS domain-containing protein [Flavobacteriales bacterium]